MSTQVPDKNVLQSFRLIREDFGLTDDAIRLDDHSILRRAQKEPLIEAYSELLELESYCRGVEAQNEGLLPLSEGIIRDTLWFLKSTAVMSRKPAIAPIAGGGLGLQWTNAKKDIFTASIFGDGQAVVAFILGKNSASGTYDVKEPPAGMLADLKKHFAGV